MKLVSYSAKNDGAVRGGILVGSDLGTILDLGRGLGFVGRAAAGGSVLDLVQAGAAGLEGARELVAAHEAGKLPEAFAEGPTTVKSEGVRLHAPIPRPPSMRDGYAFRQHVETARRNRGLEMIPEFGELHASSFVSPSRAAP